MNRSVAPNQNFVLLNVTVFTGNVEGRKGRERGGWGEFGGGVKIVPTELSFLHLQDRYYLQITQAAVIRGSHVPQIPLFEITLSLSLCFSLSPLLLFLLSLFSVFPFFADRSWVWCWYCSFLFWFWCEIWFWVCFLTCHRQSYCCGPCLWDYRVLTKHTAGIKRKHFHILSLAQSNHAQQINSIILSK